MSDEPRPDERFPGVMIHPSAYVDDGAEIGEGSKVWHFCHLLPGCRVGSGTSLGQNIVLGPGVSLGDRCKLQNNIQIPELVTIEDDVFVGPGTIFTNVLTPRASVSRKDEYLPTFVRRGASIGGNATIICGNEVGEYAMVAAAAVVTKDVPAFALMAGVPARRIGWVSHAGEVLDETLTCPRTGDRYVEDDGQLRLAT